MPLNKMLAAHIVLPASCMREPEAYGTACTDFAENHNFILTSSLFQQKNLNFVL
jgi:hypothetical protein